MDEPLKTAADAYADSHPPPVSAWAQRGGKNTRAEQRIKVRQCAYVASVGDPESRMAAKVRDITADGVGLVLNRSVRTGAALKVEIGGRLLLGKVRYRIRQGSKYLVGLEIFPSWEAFVQTLLDRQAEELNRCHAELQSLASAVSPDLQESLSIVTLYLELLARTNERQAELDSREFISHALGAANRVKNLVQDLLAYHSWVVGEQADFYPVNTEYLLEDIVAHRAGVGQAGTVTYDPLPTVIGNGPQLKSLFQNLISNGLKFNRHDCPEVHVWAESAGAEWLFAVRDNGIGVGCRDRERIFFPFVRLEAAREYEGTGLGLSVCRAIVQRHGGRIWVDEAPAEGTTVRFTIPATPPLDRADGGEQPRQDVSRASD